MKGGLQATVELDGKAGGYAGSRLRVKYGKLPVVYRVLRCRVFRGLSGVPSTLEVDGGSDVVFVIFVALASARVIFQPYGGSRGAVEDDDGFNPFGGGWQGEDRRRLGG